jgi:5'-nucleotidase
MRILITNDDGIESPALPRLIEWAKKLGEVVAVAPKVEQSAKSHAIDFTRPLNVEPVALVEGARAYSVDSTPADCVRVALLGLREKFDLVISGINRGFNMGKDIMYSGTVSAVCEAAHYKIPALALSTDPECFDGAFAYLDRVWAYLEERKLFERHGLYNVNIPMDAKGIRLTHQGGVYFEDAFYPMEGTLYRIDGAINPTDHQYPDDPTSDINAIYEGYVSVTPLVTERTAWQVFEELKER